jgi:hypothetical protein
MMGLSEIKAAKCGMGEAWFITKRAVKYTGMA